MTVASTTNKKIYTCDGGTTVFPYDFLIYDEGDLEVILYTIADGTETTLTITSEYTVSGVEEATGGNVTTVATYSSDYKLIIRRVLDLVQNDDYVENDPSSSETQEKALDKVIMIAQQQQEELDRSIKADSTQTTVDYTLPPPEASKVLGWNTSADGFDNFDNAADSVTEAAAYAAAAEASAVKANGTQLTFVNADLSTGVLTVSHSLGLTSPYSVDVTLVDNNSKKIIPDEITFSANSFAVDLSSYGTISGTWAVLYGGAPDTDYVPVPEPAAGAIIYGDATSWNEGSVDDSTIELDSGVLQVKDDGITSAKLEDDLAFGTFPTTPSAAPDADYEVANKKYVDDKVPTFGTTTSGLTVTTIYQAATDGFVKIEMEATGAGGIASATLTSDSSTPPTTSVGKVAAGNNDVNIGEICMALIPIYKDNYYELNKTSQATINKYEFIPLTN